MSTAHNTLNRCTAIVVGYDGENANLIALAHKVGFGGIQELNVSPDPKRPEFPIASSVSIIKRTTCGGPRLLK